MLNASPFKCNYCGRLKEDTNHWFLLASGTEQFTLTAWTNTVGIDPTGPAENVCSEACAIKALAKWMGSLAVG